jgi:hypothetical protein
MTTTQNNGLRQPACQPLARGPALMRAGGSEDEPSVRGFLKWFFSGVFSLPLRFFRAWWKAIKDSWNDELGP